MSTEYCLTSTSFEILAIHHDKMLTAAEKLLGAYSNHVDFEVESETEDRLSMTIYFGGEAGDSFPERVAKMASAIGPFLIGPVRLNLREETMSDERDQVFWAGPSPRSIELARLLDHLTLASDELRNVLPNGINETNPVLETASAALVNLHTARTAVHEELKAQAINLQTSDGLNDALLGNFQTKGLKLNTPWGAIYLLQGAALIEGKNGNIFAAARTHKKDGDDELSSSLSLHADTILEENHADTEETTAPVG